MGIRFRNSPISHPIFHLLPIHTGGEAGDGGLAI
jgi:hypothetical protein